MREATDPYTHGMAQWSVEDDRVLDRYRQWQLDVIRPWLGPHILEVGAGNGNFAALALAQGACQRYTALEPSPHFFKGLQALARRTPGLEPRQAPITEIAGSEQGEFDTVLSVHVLEHIEDDLGFLINALRIVRPGGYVITLVPTLPSLYGELDRQIGHFRRYTRKMAADLATRAGGELLLNRYDNLVGVLGWFWVCKIRGLDYQTPAGKSGLIWYFDAFSKYVLPVASAIEKRLPPPIGLNLTFVLRRPLSGGP